MLFFRHPENLPILNAKSLIIKIYLILSITIIYSSISYGQVNIKENINNKINNIKNTLSDSTFKIQGKVNGYSGYRPYTHTEQKKFDYRLSANLLLTYKGIKFPITYSLSNGRSFGGYNFPSFRTPSFNNLGMSPTYKWVKIHLGHRTMSFTPYTYDGLRFKGFGAELTPNKFQLLIFSGKLYQTSISDLSLKNGISDPPERKAWGSLFGYKSEVTEISGIIFQANDNKITQSLTEFKPKENTIISVKGKKKIMNDFELSFEKSFSAFNRDANEQAIQIQTHQTAYNLFGLFTKRASSIYREATKASLSYSNESFNASYHYEEIAKGYKTLGSNFFDNGYTSNTISSSFQPLDKLQVNTEGGVRTDRFYGEKTNNASRLILNLQSSYQFSEKFSSTFNISNFKNTQKLYQKNTTNFLIDSVSLALVNFNVSTSSTYLFGKEKSQMISGLFSLQKSNSINKDTVSTQVLNLNYLYNLTYNQKLDKVNYQFNASYINNLSSGLKAHIINFNALRQQELNKYINLENSIIYNYSIIIPRRITNFLIVNGIKYNIQKNAAIDLKLSLILNNLKDKFRLMETFVETNAAYSF